MSSLPYVSGLVPIQAPKSLRVLGIISLVLSGLTFVLTIVLGCFTVSALQAFHVEQQYINWMIGLNVVSAGLSAMEFLAGIGMTCLKRWGRTLGLICAFSSIPVSAAIYAGFIVVMALVNVSLERHGGTGNMETKVYMGTGCYGLPFTIVLIVMLLSGDIRRWAKGPRVGAGDGEAAASAGAAAAVAAPIAAPVVAVPAVAPVIADSGNAGRTLSGEASLSFEPRPTPKPTAAAMTISAAVPLGFGAAAPVAAPVNQVVFSPAAARVAEIAPPPVAPAMPAAMRSQLSTAALGSFIFSLMPIIPVIGHLLAFFLGLSALKRIKRSKGALRGRGLAITGVVISSLVMLLLVTIGIVVAISMWPRRATGTGPATPGRSYSLTNSVGMHFMKIEPGTFLMGSPKTEGGRYVIDDVYNEMPHRVTLTRGFYMGAYDVTVKDFAGFVKASGYQTEAEKSHSGTTWQHPGFQQEEDEPVVVVSWNDAMAFCGWLSGKEGRRYTLPTQAQWEYASRAGTQTAYSFGDSRDALGDYAWFENDSGHRTLRVGEKKPNPWGLYDMQGLVWQLCVDGDGDYSPADQVDPISAPRSAGRHALRGGCFDSIEEYCRCAARRGVDAGGWDATVGFRVVIEEESAAPAGQEAIDGGEQGRAIPSPLAGRIVYVAESGARVDAGEVLVRIDTSERAAAYSGIMADLASAKRGRDTWQDLLDKKPAVSGDEIDRLTDQLTSDKKDVARLEKELIAATAALDAGTVRAHVAGRVGAVNVETGQMVTAGQELLYLQGDGKAGAASRLEFRLVRKAEDASSPVDELADPEKPGATLKVLKDSVMDGRSLASAKRIMAASGMMEVEVVFTEEGGKRFGEVTGENVDRELAVVLDGKVLMNLRIRSEIDGGRAVISFGPGTSREEEEKLVATLNEIAGK